MASLRTQSTEFDKTVMADTKAALVLSVAAIALTGAFVFGFDEASRHTINWLMPIGSIAALGSAAMSLRAKNAQCQNWLVAGTVSLMSAAAVAAGLVAPTEFLIAAGALATGLAFAFGKNAPVAQTEPALAEQVSAKALACSFFGAEITEIDPRSKVLGQSDSFKTGSMMVDRIHVADRPAFLFACSHAIKSNQELTLRLQTPDATRFAQTRVKIQNHGGRLFVAVCHIDEGKSHFNEISRELAHELRSPLAAMVGLADALAQGHSCTDEMRRSYPELIASAGRSLIEMTGAILEADTIKTPKPDVELGFVVKDCIALMHPWAMQKSITLFNRLPATFATKSINGGALRQILTNLISNAVKFSPRGASVEVSAMISANGWTLNVTDNGEGIAPEDVARLGQKNFRGENTIGVAGYGLGLSIVRRLVDEIGASISFESRPGKGTRVVISFPASTLVSLSEFQTRLTDEPALQTDFNNAAGEKHAAA